MRAWYVIILQLPVPYKFQQSGTLAKRKPNTETVFNIHEIHYFTLTTILSSELS